MIFFKKRGTAAIFCIGFVILAGGLASIYQSNCPALYSIADVASEPESPNFGVLEPTSNIRSNHSKWAGYRFAFLGAVFCVWAVVINILRLDPIDGRPNPLWHYQEDSL